MKTSESAEILRHTAEREARARAGQEQQRAEDDVKAAEAHSELTRPEHAKGRPPAAGRAPRSSNAGTNTP